MIIDKPFGASELKILGLGAEITGEDNNLVLDNIDGLEGLTPGFLLGNQYERVDELSQVLGGDDCVDPNNQQLSDAELVEIEEYLKSFFELF